MRGKNSTRIIDQNITRAEARDREARYSDTDKQTPIKPLQRSHGKPTTDHLAIDQLALQKIRQAAVVYPQFERAGFTTEAAYQAACLLRDHSSTVSKALDELDIPARTVPGDSFFITRLLAGQPDVVINLAGRAAGPTALSIASALELAGLPTIGPNLRDLALAGDRNLFKQLLANANLPTLNFQLVNSPGTLIDEDLGLPLVVLPNTSGSRAEMSSAAAHETLAGAQAQASKLVMDGHGPVIVEQWAPGPEITTVVFEDDQHRNIFLGLKQPGGGYEPLNDETLVKRIAEHSAHAFQILRCQDVGVFDLQLDLASGSTFFTGCDPAPAFAPSLGLPFEELLEPLYGIPYETMLASLMSKYARELA